MRVLVPGNGRMKREKSNKEGGKESIVQLHFPHGFARDSSRLFYDPFLKLYGKKVIYSPYKPY